MGGPQAGAGGSMMGQVGGMMAMGAAAGVGSAVAHQAVNVMMGGGSHGQQQQQMAPEQQQQAAP